MVSRTFEIRAFEDICQEENCKEKATRIVMYEKISFFEHKSKLIQTCSKHANKRLHKFHGTYKISR